MELIFGFIVLNIAVLPAAGMAGAFGAPLILFGANRILGFSPHFGRCYVISFCHHLITFVFIFFFAPNFGKGADLSSVNSTGMILFYLLVFSIVFLMQTSTTYALLKYENKTYKDSLKIMGLVWVLTGLVCLALSIPLWFLLDGHR
jgi:hypothetical protein